MKHGMYRLTTIFKLKYEYGKVLILRFLTIYKLYPSSAVRNMSILYFDSKNNH